MKPVQSIIHQIAVRMEEEIFELIKKGGLDGLCRNCREVQTITANAALDLIRSCAEELDEIMLEDKAFRHEQNLKVHQRNMERTITLSIGELRYKRTSYRTPGTKGLIYPVDNYLGIDKKEKVSKELGAKVVQAAAELSYSQSADYACAGRVSKQTVKNKVDEIGELAVDSDHKQKTVDHLDIYADEDHIHMRKDEKHAQKYTGILPLVVVSEGKKEQNNRKSLINPIYFQGSGMKTSEFWQGIGAFLREEYDLEKIPEIILHSDGGNWIKGIDNEICGVKHVMDEFHIQEHIKRLCAGEIGSRYRLAVNTAIESGDIDSAIKICDEMLVKVSEYEKTAAAIKARKKKIREERSYLIRNKESIRERETGHHTGSCTESTVSHITAPRLSRNPMGWSTHGLSKMSMIIVYRQNGQEIPVDAIGKDKKHPGGSNYKEAPARNVSKYITYFNKQAEMTGNYDWSIFDKEDTTVGKICFERVLMNSIQNGGYAFPIKAS